MPRSSSARITPMCANPLSPPPPSTRAVRCGTSQDTDNLLLRFAESSAHPPQQARGLTSDGADVRRVDQLGRIQLVAKANTAAVLHTSGTIAIDVKSIEPHEGPTHGDDGTRLVADDDTGDERCSAKDHEPDATSARRLAHRIRVQRVVARKAGRECRGLQTGAARSGSVERCGRRSVLHHRGLVDRGELLALCLNACSCNRRYQKYRNCECELGHGILERRCGAAFRDAPNARKMPHSVRSSTSSLERTPTERYLHAAAPSPNPTVDAHSTEKA